MSDDNIEKYKEYYKLAKENYKDVYDTYNNLIDKASKLLPFISIIAGGILFCIKWLVDQYDKIPGNKSLLILLITIALLISMIDLSLILFTMLVRNYKKERIKEKDDDFFVQQEEESIYYGLAKRYVETNEKNYNVVQNKSKYLGYAQWGMIILLVYIIISTIIISLKYN